MLFFRIRIISNSKIWIFSNFERDSIRPLAKPEFRMRFGSKFRPESRILRIRMDNPNIYIYIYCIYIIYTHTRILNIYKSLIVQYDLYIYTHIQESLVFISLWLYSMILPRRYNLSIILLSFYFFNPFLYYFLLNLYTLPLFLFFSINSHIFLSSLYYLSTSFLPYI